MKFERRSLLKNLISAVAVLAVPRWLFASRPDSAFDANNADDVLKGLFDQGAVQSDQISFKIPNIAENGAVVPVTIATSLPDVESISVVVDNNPSPLAAQFHLSQQSLPEISVRIKMGETSPVRAIVKSGGKVYYTSKEVKVTIGGCGG